MSRERRSRGRSFVRMLAVLGVLAASGLVAAPSPGAQVTSRAADSCPDYHFHGWVMWQGDGDKVYAGDDCADGYTVKVSVYTYAGRDHGGNEIWRYTGLTATATRNGTWHGKSKNLPEGVRVKLHFYLSNRNGTRCHHWWDDYHSMTTSNGYMSKQGCFGC